MGELVGSSQSNILSFLELPQRTRKPRKTGLTLVRDYGLGIFAARDLVQSVGEYIDFIKFRNVLSALESDELISTKVELFRSAQIEVLTGGILFEVAVNRNRVNQLWPAVNSLGFSAVEISDNIVTLSIEEKKDYIRQASAEGLKVIFEFGKKYPTAPLVVDEAVREIESILEAGANMAIIERSELDLLLGDAADKLEQERLIQLVQRVGMEYIVLEAETTSHMVWCIRNFGADVNMGPNIEPERVARIEPMRRGLAREIGYEFFDKAAN